MQTRLNDSLNTIMWEKIYMARMLPLYIFVFLFSLLCFNVIALEFQVALSFAENMNRDDDGVLTEQAADKAWYAALAMCGVGLFFLHKPVKRLLGYDSKGLLTFLFLGAMLLILSNPFLTMVQDVRFGNSLDTTSNTGERLEQWLTGVGLTFRILFIGAAAIMASASMIQMIDAGKKGYGAWMAGREGRQLATVQHDISAGKAIVDATFREAFVHNQNLSAEFSRAVVGGMRLFAKSYERFLSGKGHLFQDSQSWFEDMEGMLEPTFTPTDPEVRMLVHDRLMEVKLPLSDLPDNVEDLSEENRQDLLAYTQWLRNNADFGTIMAAVQLTKKELSNA
jgi:hypothetical protein